MQELEEPALHRWRSPDARAALRAALRASLDAIARGPDADPERVRTLLDSGELDVWELDRGFAVGEHPWLLNAFADRF